MIHLGFGSSREDPWGSLFGGLGVGLLSQEPALSAWEAVLFPLEARRALCLPECLGFCLPDILTWLPAWFEGRFLPAWEGLSPAEVYVVALVPAWEEALSPGKGELSELLLSCFLPLREGEHLPGRLEMLLKCFLPQGKGEHLPGKLPAWVARDATKLLLSPGGRWAPAWDATKVLPSPGGRWAPAWEVAYLSCH